MSETYSQSGRRAKKLVMEGLYPATITPFAPDGAIDWTALERHLRETLGARGVRGIVVNSGLGEILQLRRDERLAIIKLALRLRKEKQIIVSGVEGHDAGLVIEEGLAAKAAGAEALLVFPPFDRRAYRRLARNVSSVLGFFKAVDDRVDLPMIVFQYPPNSGCAYSVEALAAIAQLPNVVAIKAATAGDLAAYKEVWDALHAEFSVLVGVDSPPLLDMLKHGAHGALIGISAVATESWATLLDHVATGDFVSAGALFDRVCKPLMASIFENQQPKKLTSEAAATKEALVQLGQIPSAKVRFPAISPDEETKAEIRLAISEAGLLRPAVAA
jgi:4-hydroxy-tetrahydrodipicolinate synthase